MVFGRTRAAAPSMPRVGDYSLVTKIGEGGMGVVHLAEGRDGRRVALKVLRPHVVGDDEARTRLAREVSSLRRVRCPQVAEVLDADPWGETPYVATRYVPGLSLHDHVREHGPLAGEELRWFADCLAEAVQAVHRVGVLHRDNKPSNVLLEDTAPVLIDFGLARLAEDSRLTQTGWLLGTPGYLAPEILYGEDATVAADVHAWAATVAFAGTGNPPYGRGPAMAVMDRVRRGQHDLSGLDPVVRGLVRECLAPMAHERPTLEEIRDRLAGRTIRYPGRGDRRDEPTAVVDAWTRPTRPTRPTQPTQPGPESTRAYTTYRPSGPEPSRVSPALWRGALMLAALGVVATAVAKAPYLGTLAVAIVALGARAWAWTAEALEQRRRVRGPRWYDAPAAVLTAPWYLVVATAGTVLLLLWAVGLGLLVALAAVVFAARVEVGLVAVGAVVGVALWWGPGSRRLRRQGRVVLNRASHRSWLAACLLTLLLVALVLTAWSLRQSGVDWAPAPGPPWRPGTLLAGLSSWL